MAQRSRWRVRLAVKVLRLGTAPFRKQSRLAVVVLLVVACGGQTSGQSFSSARAALQASPATASPTSSAAPEASPSLAPPTSPVALYGHIPVATSSRLTSQPQISCTGTIGDGDPVALATMHGATNEVLRDYADPVNPRNVCSFGQGFIGGSILDPHHILFNYGPVPIIVEVPSGRVHEIGVNGTVVAAAPDLSDVLWWTNSNPAALHDSWDGNDTLLQTYPQSPSRCADSNIDAAPGAFSRDSKFAYVLWNAIPEQTYLDVVGSHVVVNTEVPPSQTGGVWPNGPPPTMAVWSPVSDTLYFSLFSQVLTWNPNSPMPGLLNLPNTAWIDPAVSGNGTVIAYAVDGADGHASVHLYNVSAGQDLGRIGAGARKRPFFLTNDLIWMKSDEQGCASGGTGTYIYDLRDHTETASALDWVYATWPSTSALGG